MKYLRCLLAGALLALSPSAADAAAPICNFNIADWYFIVGDTNPPTQVFNTATGAYVNNSDTGYQTWLAGNLPCAVTGGAISAAANNGSGAVRLTVGSSANIQTGQVWQVYGTGLYDGTWTVTNVDATHVDLQSSTFTSAVTAGAIYGAVNGASGAIMATQAAMYAAINATALANWNANSAVTTPLSLTANTALTNVPAQVYGVTPNAAGWVINLPQQNLANSQPIGKPIRFTNLATLASGNYFNVRNASGSTLYAVVYPGDSVDIVPLTNTTSDGTFRAIQCATCINQGAVTTNNPWNWSSAAGSSSTYGLLYGADLGGIGTVFPQNKQFLNGGSPPFWAANDVIANSAAPSTPSSGNDTVWTDSTDKRFHDKNDAGTIGTTVVASTCAGHNFATAVGTAGVITCAQPTVSDLSGLPVTVAQGGTGDTGTPWSTFTPTVTCGSGTVTSYTTQSGRYKLQGKNANVSIHVQLNNAGTCSGTITFAGLPFTENATNPCQLVGNDYGNGIKMVSGSIGANGVSAAITTYDGTNPATTFNIVVNGVCESS